MKKISFFLLFTILSFSSLNADFLKSSSNYCVTDYWFSGGSVLYYKSSAPTVLVTSSAPSEVFLNGYEYDVDNDICSLSSIPLKLGLAYQDYMFLLGLTGLLGGFTWLFGFSLIVSRKGK